MRGFVTVVLTIFILFNPDSGYPNSEKSCRTLFDKLTADIDLKQMTAARAAVDEYLPRYLKQIGHGITYKDALIVTLYPIIGPISVVDNGVSLLKNEGIRHVWKAPFRVAKKDGGYITAAVTLAYIDSKINITQVDYNEETKEFRSELGKKV